MLPAEPVDRLAGWVRGVRVARMHGARRQLRAELRRRHLHDRRLRNRHVREPHERPEQLRRSGADLPLGSDLRGGGMQRRRRSVRRGKQRRILRPRFERDRDVDALLRGRRLHQHSHGPAELRDVRHRVLLQPGVRRRTLRGHVLRGAAQPKPVRHGCGERVLQLCLRGLAIGPEQLRRLRRSLLRHGDVPVGSVRLQRLHARDSGGSVPPRGRIVLHGRLLRNELRRYDERPGELRGMQPGVHGGYHVLQLLVPIGDVRGHRAVERSLIIPGCASGPPADSVHQREPPPNEEPRAARSGGQRA